jgi:hypothetical protein
MRSNNNKSYLSASFDRVDRKILRKQKAEKKQRTRLDENEENNFRSNKKTLRTNDIDSFTDF